MNNLEEIKYRAQTFGQHAGLEDTLYLLSIIEQAEKALERVCTDPHTHRPARDFANEALQAIRGN